MVKNPLGRNPLPGSPWCKRLSTLPFTALLLLGLALAPSTLAEPTAMVGKVLPGALEIHEWKFQSHFPDGTPIAEITQSVSDGIALIHLKAADSCLEVTFAAKGIAGAAKSNPSGQLSNVDIFNSDWWGRDVLVDPVDAWQTECVDLFLRCKDYPHWRPEARERAKCQSLMHVLPPLIPTDCTCAALFDNGSLTMLPPDSPHHSCRKVTRGIAGLLTPWTLSDLIRTEYIF